MKKLIILFVILITLNITSQEKTTFNKLLETNPVGALNHIMTTDYKKQHYSNSNTKKIKDNIETVITIPLNIYQKNPYLLEPSNYTNSSNLLITGHLFSNAFVYDNSNNNFLEIRKKEVNCKQTK
jgi:hypothetical protein